MYTILITETSVVSYRQVQSVGWGGNMAEVAGPGDREVKLQGQRDRREAETKEESATPSPVHDHTSIYTCDGHTCMFFADFTPYDTYVWYSCTYVRVTS